MTPMACPHEWIDITTMLNARGVRRRMCIVCGLIVLVIVKVDRAAEFNIGVADGVPCTPDEIIIRDKTNE